MSGDYTTDLILSILFALFCLVFGYGDIKRIKTLHLMMMNAENTASYYTSTFVLLITIISMIIKGYLLIRIVNEFILYYIT